MKKFNKYIALLMLLILSQIGCTDFLDEKVYTEVRTEDYGQTASEINSLIAPIYTGLRLANHTLDPGSAPIYESSGDAVLIPTRRGGDWWDGGSGKEMRLGKWTPTNNGIVVAYNRIMERVASANQILYMVENNDLITDKTEYINQIRAARAYWYYHLVDGWGNVPIVTDFGDATLPATKSRAEVYAFIMSELLAIKDVIRADVTPASYGLFTKGAVYTMLAKMYLNAMVWNPAGGPKWQETIDACNVVMALPYRLNTVWKDNFKTFNESSPESILTVVNSLTTQGAGSERGMRIATMTLHYYDKNALGLLISGANGHSAMPDYVKSFDTTDKRYLGSFLIGPMTNPNTGAVLITAHGRPLIHTVDITMKYAIDADGWGQVEQEDGARCNKWEMEKGVTTLQNDCALFRLADIYLMKAEALVRLGQNNAEATRLVNEIRKRGFDDPAKLKTSVTLDDIYKERRFEFAWEDLNRQDMIRFGTFLNPIPGWRGALPEFRLLFPIPQTALNSNPSLVQNPGY